MKPTKLKLNKGMKAIKFVLFIFNFLFLIFGLKLIVVGSILNVQFKEFLDFQGTTSIGGVAAFIIIFGIVVTIISFFGSGGAIRESRCMILTFTTFLVMTFFLMLVVVCIIFSVKDKMFEILKVEMMKSINSTQPGVVKTWNLLQREFKCCGFYSPEDWYKRGAFVPDSCCNNDLDCPSDENPLYPNGCFQSLSNWTSGNISIMASIALVIAIFQIFGTTFSCLLARSIKRGYEIMNE